MGTEPKRARFVTDDPNRVLELIELEGSDHEGMSSDEESDLDRQLANSSDEAR